MRCMGFLFKDLSYLIKTGTSVSKSAKKTAYDTNLVFVEYLVISSWYLYNKATDIGFIKKCS